MAHDLEGLSEREKTEIAVFLEACEEALRFSESKASAHDSRDRQRAQLQIERIKGLLRSGVGSARSSSTGFSPPPSSTPSRSRASCLAENRQPVLLCRRPSWPSPAERAHSARSQQLGTVQHRPVPGSRSRAGAGHRARGSFRRLCRRRRCDRLQRRGGRGARALQLFLVRLRSQPRHLVSLPRFTAATSTTTAKSVSPTRTFSFTTSAPQMQLGAWGVGFSPISELRPAAGRATWTIRRSPRRSAGARWCSGDRSSAVSCRSVGARAASRSPSIRSTNGTATNQLDMSGVGPEVGVLIRPDYRAVAHRRHISRAGRRPDERQRRPTRDRAAYRSSRRRACSCHGSSRSERRFKSVRVRSIRVGSTRTIKKPASESRSVTTALRAARPRRPSCGQLRIRAACTIERASFLVRGDVHSPRRGQAARPDQADPAGLERSARYANWPRERITVLIDLLISGKAHDAIGLESFFSEQAALAGPTANAAISAKRAERLLQPSPRPRR